MRPSRIATAATAVAADPTVAGFGAREQLSDARGAAVTGWTVNELKSSSDAIPYAVSGRLYEVTAAVDAVQGTVTPMVSNFNARATDGALMGEATVAPVASIASN